LCDLKQRKSDTVASGVRFFEVSFNGEKTLTAQADRWAIRALRPIAPASGAGTPASPAGPAGPTPPAGGPAGPGATPGDGVLRTESIEVRSDPRAEWKQMFHDAWRIQREFFYDPDLHGLDLVAAINKH